LTPASWRAFGRRYVVALIATFVLLTGGIVGANMAIDQRLDDIPRINGLELPEGPGEAGNYLVIGSDSREFVESEGEAEAFGTEADAGPPKSDTLMVVHIDPEAKTSLLVSFPRDLIVDIPGEGEDQINAAFNQGGTEGAQRVIDTLKHNFDLDINHYVEVNFKAFTGIVDAIGEIPVFFPAPAKDEYSGLNIPTAGCVPLDGTQALEYVRARHLEYLDTQTGEWTDASPRADLDRIVRQQTFIRKLAAAAAAKGASNPLTAYEIADATVPKLKIDEQLGKKDIFRLVNTFRKVNPEDDSAIEMITIPNEASDEYEGKVEVKQPDADQVLQRLRTFGSSGAEEESVDPKLLPAQVRVRVLNGSGIVGIAAETMAQLEGYSFANAGVGNAGGLRATEIRYRPGNEDKAKLVGNYLGGVGRRVADDSISDADVVLVLAKDFDGVTAPNGSAKGSTSTTKAASGSTPAQQSGDGDEAEDPAAGC
jgi:LCP family protein required for cell wall assembly